MTHNLHIIETPSHCFMFVGTVPLHLGLIGSEEDIQAVAHCGFIGTLKDRVKNRTFPTEQEARDFATLKGYEVHI